MGSRFMVKSIQWVRAVLAGLCIAGLLWAAAVPCRAAENSSARVRHVILFIGDGMGWWHVDAARRYVDRGPLAMETLEHHGYMTTYMRNTVTPGSLPHEYWDDASVPGSYDPVLGGATPWEKIPVPAYVRQGATDSAASAGAMANGHKQVKYTLNVAPSEEGYDGTQPNTVRFHPIISEFAKAEGMAVGLATSVKFYDATPAAFVAKTPYRRNYHEIIRQMLYSEVDVIMGAGHPYYDDNGRRITPYWTASDWSVNRGAHMEDGDGGELYRRAMEGLMGRVFLDTREAFHELAEKDLFRGGPLPARVFGLARAGSTLQYNRFGTAPSGPKGHEGKVETASLNPLAPTLAVMTQGALRVLDAHPGGFFLMVEGGAVDWASHANDLQRMIEELVDLDTAVNTVIQWVNEPSNGSTWENTLVVVTSDHECGHLQPVGDVVGREVTANQCWGLNCAGWNDHTNSLVPVYAQGPGGEFFQARFHGDYKDNTDVFRVLYRAVTGRPFHEAVSTRREAQPN